MGPIWPNCTPSDAQGVMKGLGGVILVREVVWGRLKGPWGWFTSRLLLSTLHMSALDILFGDVGVGCSSPLLVCTVRIVDVAAVPMIFLMIS